MENKTHPIKTQNQYYYIGRLLSKIAKEASVKHGLIYIDDNHLKHVNIAHKKELDAIGFDAWTFINIIVKNFNEIRQGSNNSLLLIIYNGKPKVTAIELNFSLKKEFYEVKTATVMSKEAIHKKRLLWKK